MDGPQGGDILTWILTLVVTITIPTLFGLLVASKNEQIRDQKEQLNTVLPELRNLSAAIRDLSAAQRAREDRH